MAKGVYEDITGQKFGRLTAIKRIENVGGRPCFLCVCDCGGSKNVKTTKLKDSSVRSCGCLQKESIEAQTKNITGQIFGRLTVVKRDGHLERGMDKVKISAYLCQCICGNTRKISGSDLRSGHTTSCGCGRAIDDSRISSAKTIYGQNYSDGDLTFEQFMELSQKNCFYCNSSASNNFNNFTSKFAAELSRLNGNFLYNGLDRVNSNLPHDFSNLVPCCKICNKAKGKMTIDDFKNLIIKSYNYLTNPIKIENANIDQYLHLLNNKSDELYNFQYNKTDIDYGRKLHPAISSAKKIYDQRYSDGDLTFEKFLQLTQCQCEYCGEMPTNKCNRFKNIKSASQYAIDVGTFYYNWLDRINSNLKHDLNNLVTACKVCNWVKCNALMNDYKAWIIRVFLQLIETKSF
jgi:hypothetical protein